ncbi:peptidase M50 [Thiosulfatimonas sediminis]|uniref:Peptidase M50 n=1 Tax=Thiosulfatimonas sediminis TaxID=2675054 RepID=A0A6F8PUY0_9GAMM|nr:site-2 protease family protein [Thiosulfatimonas sediminis]BBP45952.1 peptidase M50 [Thiosulfatimonas sediminis]
MEQLNTIQLIAVWALPVLFAITLHEAAHGWMANKLGDPTAKMLGRVTLNPIKHIDPIGTIVVPIVLLMLGGFLFGWAKAVPITDRNFKRPQVDMAWVAIAGPASNLLMALGWAVVLKIGLLLQNSAPEIGQFMVYSGTAGISINLILLVLNLLPIPPLDGSRVLVAFISKKMAWQFYRLEPYGFFILLGLLLLGLLAPILMGPYSFLQNLIYRLFGL